ncbi:MAG: formyltransferase family protein, partial [Phycisphaerae bacterium]
RTWHAEGILRPAGRLLMRSMPRRAMQPGDRNVSPLHDTRSLARRWLRGDRTNGPATLAALRAAAPDLLLLGGCGIVRRPLLEIPAIGSINAHPGLLPEFRGVSVVAWSLHLGCIPGATVHWVDEGVDTGDLILRRSLPSLPGPMLADVERAVGTLAVALMIEAVEQVADGTAPRMPQTASEGRRYSLMPKAIRREVVRDLRRGAVPREAVA